MLQLAGADRVLTMDLHAGQIQGFFTIPVDHMTALPLLRAVLPRPRSSGDERRLRRARRGPGKTGGPVRRDDRGDLAVMHKTRPAHNVARGHRVTGDVDGKIAIMGDDMIDTAGTLIAGAQALKEHGAKEVYVFATHGIFSPPALERIEESAARQRRRHRHGPDRPAARSPSA